MPSFTNSYTEPGTYVVIDDDVITQTNTGLLSVCIIGTGKTTKTINNLELDLVPPTIFRVKDLVNATNFDMVNTTLVSSVAEWAASTEYTVGMFVINSSSVYVCSTAHTSGETFDATKFTLVNTLESYTGSTLNINTNVIYSNVIYKSIQAVVVPASYYSTWEASTYYTLNSYMTYSSKYYVCIEAHTSISGTPTGEYLVKYWKEVSPDTTNYSAEIPNSDTYPVLVNYEPTKVIGAITTKVYNNYVNEDGTSSTTKVYFNITNNGTKFVWINANLPTSDLNAQGVYILSMSYTAEKDAVTDGKIKSFTRLSSIFSTYGDPSVENTISAAAQIAYDNGATVFYCVQPLGENCLDEYGNLTRTGLQEGLRQAKTVDTYCIVPMMDSTATTNIATLCKSHVESMSSTLERKERICILSNAIKSTSSIEEIEAVIEEYKSAAKAIDSPRILYLVPSSVNVNIGNDVVPSSGMYAAAALAGIICNNNFTCGEPITGKTLADVTIDDQFTREEKNQMASYGCLVLEGSEGTTIPKVRHALSTSTGDYVKTEIKITKIKDVISSTLRLALDRAYINTRFLGASTISEMTTTVNTILSSFLANNDIYSYSDLVIAQDTNYPNQVNVSFRIAPAVDINYILITFGVSFNG